MLTKWHMLNMELDPQSLFGLHVHCTAFSLAETPQSPLPPHLGSYTRALLVSQDGRHLFGDPRMYRRKKERSATQIRHLWKKKNCIKAQFYFYKELRNILGNVVSPVHAVHFVLCCNLYLITAPPLLFSLILLVIHNAIPNCRGQLRVVKIVFFSRKRSAENRWYSFQENCQPRSSEIF